MNNENKLDGAGTDPFHCSFTDSGEHAVSPMGDCIFCSSKGRTHAIRPINKLDGTAEGIANETKLSEKRCIHCNTKELRWWAFTCSEPKGHELAVEPAAPVAGVLSHDEHRRACMFNLPAYVFGTSPKASQPTPVVVSDAPKRPGWAIMDYPHDCREVYYRKDADAYMDHLEKQIAKLSAQPAPLPGDDECHDCMKLLKERDDLEERLDELAEAVSEHFEVPIGEHSSANDPIQVAFEILGGGYKTKYDAPIVVPDERNFTQLIADLTSYAYDDGRTSFSVTRSEALRIARNCAEITVQPAPLPSVPPEDETTLPALVDDINDPSPLVQLRRHHLWQMENGPSYINSHLYLITHKSLQGHMPCGCNLNVDAECEVCAAQQKIEALEAERDALKADLKQYQEANFRQAAKINSIVGARAEFADKLLKLFGYTMYTEEYEAADIVGEVMALKAERDGYKAILEEQEQLVCGTMPTIRCRNGVEHPRDTNSDCDYCREDAMRAELSTLRSQLDAVGQETPQDAWRRGYIAGHNVGTCLIVPEIISSAPPYTPPLKAGIHE